MKVNVIKSMPPVPIDSVPDGDVFDYEGKVFMALDLMNDVRYRGAVALDDGGVAYFPENIIVKVYERAELKVYE